MSDTPAPADAAVEVLNYVADMTFCGADGDWHLKPDYDPQRVLDTIAKANSAPTAIADSGTEKAKRMPKIVDVEIVISRIKRRNFPNNTDKEIYYRLQQIASAVDILFHGASDRLDDIKPVCGDNFQRAIAEIFIHELMCHGFEIENFEGEVRRIETRVYRTRVRDGIVHLDVIDTLHPTEPRR